MTIPNQPDRRCGRPPGTLSATVIHPFVDEGHTEAAASRLKTHSAQITKTFNAMISRDHTG
jgi:hypothetical protein